MQPSNHIALGELLVIVVIVVTEPNYSYNQVRRGSPLYSLAYSTVPFNLLPALPNARVATVVAAVCGL